MKLLALTPAALFSVPQALAQSFPERPIRFAGLQKYCGEVMAGGIRGRGVVSLR